MQDNTTAISQALHQTTLAPFGPLPTISLQARSDKLVHSNELKRRRLIG